VALAFDNSTDRTNSGPAKQAAREFAVRNGVFGAAPDVQFDSDVIFYSDDPGKFPNECSPDNCIRVDVYRNQTRANPLPMWFGQLVGLTEQGVRAMAIARAGFGGHTNRARPWGLPDRWEENCTPPGDSPFEFTEAGTAPDGPNCLSDDNYLSCLDDEENCTGYSPEQNLGDAFILKNGDPHDNVVASHFNPIVLTSSGRGGSEYRDAIANGGEVSVGDWIDMEPGNKIGPTAQGMDDLIAQDPDAQWSQEKNCVIRPPGDDCVDSPRIVCIPVFDPVEYFAVGHGGRFPVLVTNLLGMFVEEQGEDPPPGTDFINEPPPDDLDGSDVWGWLTHCPGDSGGTSVGPNSFIRFVELVR
jgi:hypothetical protein